MGRVKVSLANRILVLIPAYRAKNSADCILAVAMYSKPAFSAVLIIRLGRLLPKTAGWMRIRR